MSESEALRLQTLLSEMPKVDLHRHLEGSVRLETLLDIAQQYRLDIPAYTLEGLRSHVQIVPGEPMDAAHFLGKFNVLRRFYYSQEVIQRIAREAVEDAAADNVKYLELRCTPRALSKLMDFSFDSVISWVCEAVAEAVKGLDIRVQVLVSINRHESQREAERAIRVAMDHRKQGVVGVDLAGREPGFPASAFYELFAEAKQAGMGVTVHAGEWADPVNIREAIRVMGARRIGHGVRVVEDNTIVQLARENGVIFEVCPTSNIQSGAVSAEQQHPLSDMIHLGLKTTINTDDPSVSNITLSGELELALSRLGLTLDDVKRCIFNAIDGAFLPDEERAALAESFSARLVTVTQRGA